MKFILNYLVLLCVSITSYGNSLNDPIQQKLLASDYRIFQDTKAWELAKAINSDNTERIKQLVSADKKLIAVVDPKYSQTLLGLAVYDRKYNSVKTLLELGADPNAFNNYDGQTPLMNSVTIGSEKDPRYLEVLLKHGGNPNLERKALDDYSSEHGPRIPLVMAALDGNLEKVKMLVGAGADLHKHSSKILAGALFSDNPDIVIYLLNNGADYKRPVMIGTSISDMLRFWTFDLGSENYKKKMQIVEFLKAHGIDYRKSKIPEIYYKKYNKEYLEKY